MNFPSGIPDNSILKNNKRTLRRLHNLFLSLETHNVLKISGFVEEGIKCASFTVFFFFFFFLVITQQTSEIDSTLFIKNLPKFLLFGFVRTVTRLGHVTISVKFPQYRCRRNLQSFGEENHNLRVDTCLFSFVPSNSVLTNRTWVVSYQSTWKMLFVKSITSLRTRRKSTHGWQLRIKQKKKERQ